MKKISDNTIEFNDKKEIEEIVEALRENMRNNTDSAAGVKKLFATLDNLLDIMD